MDAHTRNVSLRFGATLYERMRAFHLAPGKAQESLSYAWARAEETAAGLRILLPDSSPYFPFSADCFTRQSAGNVQLRADVLNGMLAEFAATDFNCIVNVHDHWFAQEAHFSAVDDEDDARFDRYLREQFEPMLATYPHIGPARDIVNVSIVFAQQSLAARLTNTMHASCTAASTTAIELVTVLDNHWRTAPIVPAERTIAAVANDEERSRHAEFIPASTANAIERVTVGLVGCGGLGSILAESLVRTGFRKFVLVDDDEIEATNLNRWQGGRLQDVGTQKAYTLAARMRGFATDVQVTAIATALDDDVALHALTGVDVLCGGVDNDAARWLLNHVSLQYMIPWFDAGVAITTAPAVDFASRYFSVLPGITGCAMCKGVDLIDHHEVVDEYADATTQRARRAAGYVIDQPLMVGTPSAYLLNQLAASSCAMEVLNYFAAWRPTATLIQKSWRADRIARADRENYAEVPSQSCALCSTYTGVGSALALPRRNRSVLSLFTSSQSSHEKEMSHG